MALHKVPILKQKIIIPNSFISFFSFSNIGPMADLMSASSAYMDKNSCYNSQVYGQNYSSHCYYGNMEYLSSGVPHSSLNVPSVSFWTFLDHVRSDAVQPIEIA